MCLEEVLTHFKKVRKCGNGYTARCPAHDDKNPSLSIKATNGRILMHCHAGCDTEAIMDVIGLKMSDLFCGTEFLENNVAEKNVHNVRKLIATYDYKDADNKLIYQKLRYSDKSFAIKKPNGEYNRAGIAPMLYNLPALANSYIIYIAEGEKDIDNLAKMGLVAVSPPDGAGTGKWSGSFNKFFANKIIYILKSFENSPIMLVA